MNSAILRPGLLGALLLLVLLTAPDVLAQRLVRGTVIGSDTGETLPGVNVGVKGTTIGTTSDIDGNYEVTLPADRSTLVFSFIGYRTQEQDVPPGAERLDVELQTDILNLDEVVVTGLASSVKRENLANAVRLTLETK